MEQQRPPPSLHNQLLPPPSKVARLSDPTSCVGTGMANPMAATADPELTLGLEEDKLGFGAAEGKSSLFTFLQLQELRQQALIYKYMVSGLPIPLHLVLPIWKSVAGSAAAAAAAGSPPAAYPRPRFMWCSGSSMCFFDYSNFMEPEPGRCRRTDGKKWRCSRDVVPDHKYCERHLHRGRHRSRKPVEVVGAAANANAAASPPLPPQQPPTAAAAAAAAAEMATTPPPVKQQ